MAEDEEMLRSMQSKAVGLRLIINGWKIPRVHENLLTNSQPAHKYSHLHQAGIPGKTTRRGVLILDKANIQMHEIKIK